jgi:hypothetical protein
MVRDFWAGQEFDLMLKDYQGNCDLCFLKSENKRKSILIENPNIAHWWSSMEKLTNSTFQLAMPVSQLLAKSRIPNYKKAIDAYEKSKMEPELFATNFDISCFCGD